MNVFVGISSVHFLQYLSCTQHIEFKDRATQTKNQEFLLQIMYSGRVSIFWSAYYVGYLQTCARDMEDMPLTQKQNMQNTRVVTREQCFYCCSSSWKLPWDHQEKENTISVLLHLSPELSPNDSHWISILHEIKNHPNILIIFALLLLIYFIYRWINQNGFSDPDLQIEKDTIQLNNIFYSTITLCM